MRRATALAALVARCAASGDQCLSGKYTRCAGSGYTPTPSHPTEGVCCAPLCCHRMSQFYSQCDDSGCTPPPTPTPAATPAPPAPPPPRVPTIPLWADFGSSPIPRNYINGLVPGGASHDCWDQSKAPGPTDQCWLTDKQAAFVAGTYNIVSLEKCFGVIWQNNKQQQKVTIANQIEQARRLKALNPNVTILAYFDAEMVYADCYAEGDEFMANPSWWLRGDGGEIVHEDTTPAREQRPSIDVTVAAAREWWSRIPIKILKEGAGAIDGIFLDATSGRDWTAFNGVATGISANRSAAWNQALFQMVGDLRDQIHAQFPGAPVYGNGLWDYDWYLQGGRNHGMYSLDFLDGIMIEHVAAFEDVDPQNGTVGPQHMVDWVRLIGEAAGKVGHGGNVLVKGWIGPENGEGSPAGSPPIDPVGPTWPKGQGMDGRQRTSANVAKAGAARLDWILGVFLCAWKPGTYFSYSWWYDVLQGYVPCPEGTGAAGGGAGPCDAPNDYYAQFYKPVGKPAGDAAVSGYTCRREFEGVSVHVDLADTTQAKPALTWKNVALARPRVGG